MRREQRLADAVVELTDTLVKDFDVTDQVTLLWANALGLDAGKATAPTKATKRK